MKGPLCLAVLLGLFNVSTAAAGNLSQSQQGLCTFFGSARNVYNTSMQSANAEPNALKRDQLARSANQMRDSWYRTAQAVYLQQHRPTDYLVKVTAMNVGHWFAGAEGLDMQTSFTCPDGAVIQENFHFVSRPGTPPGFRQTDTDTPFTPWRSTLENINVGDTVTFTGDVVGGSVNAIGLRLEPGEISSIWIALVNGASLKTGTANAAQQQSAPAPTAAPTTGCDRILANQTVVFRSNTPGSSCSGDCVSAEREKLRAHYLKILDIQQGFPGMHACVGFRADLGGTSEGAHCILAILGEPYQLSSPTNNPTLFCQGDGYPYIVGIK